MSLVILDARPAFAADHLEGAEHADLNTQLSAASAAAHDPRRGGRHPLPPIGTWARQLGAWGITPSTDVVIYDDADASNAAARAWWMLRAVGHERVRVLDRDWRSSGLRADAPLQAAPAYSVTEWQLPAVDMNAVDRARRDPAWKVLDVRSAPRFRGETEPIDPVAGHIPGAVNLPFTENLRDGAFKTAEELRGQYETLLGDTPADHLIVHCGSGVTACHTLLALDRAGLAGASLYVGSWSEWCRNDMPIGR
ncbi:MAG TPA: rhodanese-like domain-containing protein [Thermoanaerobaculia bacterium]|nr:rhodanese-like domain-containing protein [Thermoanaerobaculia bacterium]